MIAQQNKYCGVDRWHEAGITGDGIAIWNMENGKATHGKQTTQRVLHAAPGATVINGSLSAITSNKEIKEVAVTTDDGTRYEVEDFIEKFGIKLVTRSQGGSRGRAELWSKFWQPLKEKYNLIFFNSAGNEGSEGSDAGLPPGIAIYVAACHLDAKGTPTRDWWYSSIDEKVDFIDFRGEWNGTSFAAPYLCGKAALLVQKYGGLAQEEVYEYFKSRAEDLEEPGRDDKSGWGLPIMGDPGENLEEDENVKFDDVKEGVWYEKAVEHVTDKGYMVGTGPDTFKPDKPVTRAELAQVLYAYDQKNGRG